MASRLLSASRALLAVAVICGCDAARPGNPPDAAVVHIGSSPPAKCELHLELPATIAVHSRRRVDVQIRNVGPRPVTLVEPGDGSDAGWRTPIIAWSILPAASKDEHPKEPLVRPVGRCGNINPLKPNEVFVLSPGGTRDLGEWVTFPPNISPGKYRVALYYVNVPDLAWSGLPLGDHNRAAMRRVRSSTPASLVSNEVRVEVIE